MKTFLVFLALFSAVTTASTRVLGPNDTARSRLNVPIPRRLYKEGGYQHSNLCNSKQSNEALSLQFYYGSSSTSSLNPRSYVSTLSAQHPRFLQCPRASLYSHCRQAKGPEMWEPVSNVAHFKSRRDTNSMSSQWPIFMQSCIQFLDPQCATH